MFVKSSRGFKLSAFIRLVGFLIVAGLLFAVAPYQASASPALQTPGWTDCSQSLYVAMEGNGNGGSTVVRADCNGALDEYANGFNGTSGLAIDASGDLMISDDSPGIWSVDTAGTVTPIATTVSFANPNGLYIDGLGRLLVADSGNSILRLTLDSSGNATSTEILATGFNNPQGVAELSSGDVIFTAMDGFIYSIAPTDTLPIVFPAVANRLISTALVPGNQGSIALDSSENIFISDFSGDIVQIDSSLTARLVVDITSGSCPVGSAGDNEPSFRGLTFSPDGDLVATGYCLDNVYIFDGGDIATAFATSTPIATLPSPFIENPLGALDGEINGPFGISFFAAAAEKPFVTACLLPEELAEIYVDGNHTGPFNGTLFEPFATIQDGLTAASAGTVINVAAGTYTENLDVLTENIHFRGEGSDTIIDGSGGASNGIRYGEDNITIAGFRFTGSDNLSSGFVAGVAVNSSRTPTGVQICNNVFDTNEAGVAVGNSSPLLINNTFFNNEMGVSVAALSVTTVRNNIFENNGIAIDVVSPGVPVMDHNLFFANALDFFGTVGCDAGDGCVFGSNPLLTNASSNDYHLLSGSPAIDAGSNASAPVDDYEGELRPVDGDGNGTHITDIGADEKSAEFGEITGRKFWDKSDDQIKDDEEQGLEGWTIYLDTNDNGLLDVGETSVLTDSLGFYRFPGLSSGTYNVREVLEPGWEQTFPGNIFAPLGGINEVPPVTTSGQGFAWFDFDDVTNELEFGVDFDDLSGTTTGMHIHRGNAGENGPVLYDLVALAGAPSSGFTSPLDGTVTIDPGDVTDLLSGGLYVNIHSSIEPGGEIRGQIINNDEKHVVGLGTGEIVNGKNFGNIEVDDSDNCSCVIGVFETDNTHDWELVFTGTTLPTGGPVELKVSAETVNVAESGSILVSIVDESGLKTLEVTHPSTMTANVDFLELDINPGEIYSFTVENTGTAHHYTLGTEQQQLKIGHTEVSYLEMMIQDWGIMASSGETVELELATDSSNGGANQAGEVEVTVYDAVTDALVYGPAHHSLTLDSAETVSFANGASDRELRIRLEPDGHLRMKKIGGDTLIHILPCPDQLPHDDDVPDPDPDPTPGDTECSCEIGIFEADNTHDWILVWDGTGFPSDVFLKVVAMTITEGESGSILATITDDSGLKTLEVYHPSTVAEAEDFLLLDLTPGVPYALTIEQTGTAHHYKIGSDDPDLLIGQDGISFLEGTIQDWEIVAGPSENVEIVFATDSVDFGTLQSSQIDVTVLDGNTVIYGPATLSMTVDVPQSIAFTNTTSERDLTVRVDPNLGHFGMTKVGGDTMFYVLDCPEAVPSSPPVVPMPGVGQWGIVAMAGLMAAAFVWHRRRKNITSELA